MKNNFPHGLRMFLLTLLEMVKNGVEIPCNTVENAISSGIATYFWNNHQKYFELTEANFDNVEGIDQYYRKFTGVSDGKEFKYLCEKKDGVALAIALALNDIY